MGIKEQTVSVHIRGSYRYRCAPYNRNRRSKRASVSFHRRFLLWFVVFPAMVLPSPRIVHSHKKSLPTCSPITQYLLRINHATSCGRRKSEKRPERGVRSPRSVLTTLEEYLHHRRDTRNRRYRNYRKNNGVKREVTREWYT